MIWRLRWVCHNSAFHHLVVCTAITHCPTNMCCTLASDLTHSPPQPLIPIQDRVPHHNSPGPAVSPG